MSAERLGPQAESALRRTATGRIESDKRVQQEGHGITADVEIAVIDVGDVGQGIEVLHVWTVGIVHHLAARIAIRDAQDFRQRFAVRVFDNRVFELAAAYEIDGRTVVQRPLRQRSDMRPDEAYLEAGVRFLHPGDEADIAGEPRRTGKQDQEFVLLANLDGFFRGNVVRRRIQQA